MWICPDCKREFENTNQQHFCTNKPETIDEYIAQQPEEVQEILKEVRSTIKSILPDAQERMTWGMPTFWDKHNIIHFASFKKHLGIYPGPDAIIYFAEELKEYKTSKGTKLSAQEKNELLTSLEKEMREASRKLEFERAAKLRDMIVELKGSLPAKKPSTKKRRIKSTELN